MADAHDDTRAVYREWLESAGFVVEEAGDGRDALTRLLAAPPTLLVADAHLPSIDALSLCGIIRQDVATRRVAIVVVASDARTADTLRAGGADAVLVKPLDPEALLAEARRLTAEPRPDASAIAPSADRPVPEAETTKPPLKTSHRRYTTTAPPAPPPDVRCPSCDRALIYRRSHVGGVSSRHVEQWDEFSCEKCGAFEYRHRTRRLRSID